MNLHHLGWTDKHVAKWTNAHVEPTCVAGRVVSEERDAWRVLCAAGASQPRTESHSPDGTSNDVGSGEDADALPASDAELTECLATIAGRLRQSAISREELPATGDWVAVQRSESRRGVIHAVLPRKTALMRSVAGTRSDAQIMAANIDVVFVVTGLDNDYNPRRIERYLTLVFNSGAQPVVLLNKADLCPDVAPRVAEVQALAGGAPVHAISALDADGLDRVRAHLAPGETTVIVGSSGAGKSTLINALLGDQRQATGDVRRGDDRGRHTTTRRELFLLPGGALLIDTPGVRELQLTGNADALRSSFADIERLAQACRFRDCRHDNEPGCAVHAAIESGALPPERLASLRKLRRELESEAARNDPEKQRERTQKWKTIHKAAKKHMKRKYRGLRG